MLFKIPEKKCIFYNCIYVKYQMGKAKKERKRA